MTRQYVLYSLRRVIEECLILVTIKRQRGTMPQSRNVIDEIAVFVCPQTEQTRCGATGDLSSEIQLPAVREVAECTILEPEGQAQPVERTGTQYIAHLIYGVCGASFPHSWFTVK